MSTVEGIIKGDSVDLECTVTGEDITGWKIRCEIYDSNGHSIKRATANSGGADDQIKITDGANGEFTIYLNKAQTTDFNNTSNIEIEAELTDEKVYTIYQERVEFEDEKITWTTPS